MGGQRKLQHILKAGQPTTQGFPVLLPRLDKLRKAPQLYPAYGGLGIERLEVEAQVAVGVFMVVTLG